MGTMDIHEPRNHKLRGAAVFSSTALLVPLCAWSADWDFRPTLNAGAIYTDNVRLTDDSQADSAFVLQLAPGFSLERDDEDLNVGVNYTLQGLLYSGTDDDSTEVFHSLDAQVSSKLITDAIRIDASGGIFQQVVDPTVSFSNNNLQLTDNRTDGTDINVAPSFRQNLGDFARVLMRYDYGQLNYDDARLLDATRQQFLFRVGNTETADVGLTWSLDYRFDRQEFDLSPEAEFASANLELGMWFTNNWRVFGVIGQESNFEQHRTRAELDEDTWSAGLNWRVGNRDDLQVSFGERVFGSTFNFRWLHQFEPFSLSLNYLETPTTNAAARFNRRTSVVDIGEIGLDDGNNTDVFLQERLTAEVQYTGNRSTATLAFTQENRSERVVDDGVVSDQDEDTLGVRASLNWQAGAKTNFGAALAWENSEFRSGADSDLVEVQVDAGYALGSRTDLRLELNHLRRDADARDELTENRVGLYLDRDF